MSDDHSVSGWIAELKGGSDSAAGSLAQRYFARLVELALAKLKQCSAQRRVADEEDVALAAFDSFCRRAREGRFPNLADRDDLWRLLVTIAERKAANLVRDQRRQKRGGGAVRGDSMFRRPDDSQAAGIEQVADAEPTPEEAALVAENTAELLSVLTEDQRAVALHKLEGYTNSEIANLLDCAVSTVERRLRLIRKKWSKPD